MNGNNTTRSGAAGEAGGAEQNLACKERSAISLQSTYLLELTVRLATADKPESHSIG